MSIFGLVAVLQLISFYNFFCMKLSFCKPQHIVIKKLGSANNLHDGDSVGDVSEEFITALQASLEKSTQAVRSHEHFENGFLVVYYDFYNEPYFYLSCFRFNSKGTQRDIIVPNLRKPAVPNLNGSGTMYKNQLFYDLVEQRFVELMRKSND